MGPMCTLPRVWLDARGGAKASTRAESTDRAELCTAVASGEASSREEPWQTPRNNPSRNKAPDKDVFCVPYFSRGRPATAANTCASLSFLFGWWICTCVHLYTLLRATLALPCVHLRSPQTVQQTTLKNTHVLGWTFHGAGKVLDKWPRGDVSCTSRVPRRSQILLKVLRESPRLLRKHGFTLAGSCLTLFGS